jgi:hypothetical protein
VNNKKQIYMNTLRYALRFLLRARTYTLINLLGLAFSLACCIILLRYIHRELTVDTHCVDRENVYVSRCQIGENDALVSSTLNGDTLAVDPSLVMQRSRVTLLDHDMIRYKDNRLQVNMIVADTTFLKLFRYQLLQGEYSLSKPGMALLSEHLAHKLFGKQNPIGETFVLSTGKSVTVSGIFATPENKSILQVDAILSEMPGALWERMPMEFVRFVPGADIQKLNEAGKILRPTQVGDGSMYTFSLLSLKDVYWESRLLYRTSPTMCVSGNRAQLYVLSAMCIFIFFIGLLNYINLYAVLLGKRLRIYLLHRVWGAGFRPLFMLVYWENLVLSVLSLLLAWTVVELAQPFVNRLFDTVFTVGTFDVWVSLSLLVWLPLLISLCTVVRCWKSPLGMSLVRSGNDRKSIRLRQGFLFVQYTVTIVLVVLALFFHRHLNLLLNTPPGFQVENVIHANLVYESTDYASYTDESIQARKQRVAQIDEALSKCPDISCWTAGLYSILDFDYTAEFQNAKGETVSLNQNFATPEFFTLFNLKLVEGKLPVEEDGFVVNRAALRALGYTSLEGATVLDLRMKEFVPDLPARPIVGVIEDYYSGHISKGVRPMLFMVSPTMRGDVYQIACQPGKLSQVIDYLRKLEREVYGTENFQYSLLKDDVQKLYKSDQQVATIYSAFAFIAIVISCLGLLGISLFDIRQRYREIAIRKVNGAMLKDLYVLLLRRYVGMLLLAAVVAVPLAWLAIHYYTADLVVKAPVTVGLFLAAFLIVAVISVATLLWQVNKASRINPSEVMKNE